MTGELKSFRDVPVINLYGLTETCSAGTATPWGAAGKPGSVGMPLPGTDLKIVDGINGNERAPGRRGGGDLPRGTAGDEGLLQ